MTLTFWLLAGLVAAVTVLALAIPLLRRRDESAPDAAAHDRAVYRDQLAEVERDLQRGLLSPREAESARVEIKRRILRTDRAGPVSPPRPAAESTFLAIALFILVPAGALGVYLLIGTPGMPDMPLAERPAAVRALAGPGGAGLALPGTGPLGGGLVGGGPTAEQMRAAEEMDPAARQEMVAGMVAGLEARLEASPEDFDGWMRLGRSRLVLDQPAAARDAYARASALRPDDLQAATAHAAAILQAEGTTVPTSEAAQAALHHVLRIDPDETAALFLLGRAAGAAQDWPAAVDWFSRLQAALPPTDPRAEVVAQILEQLRRREAGEDD